MEFNLEPEETDLNIGIDLSQEKEEVESLQRTDEWFLERSGCWTASPTKKLMSCNPKGGRIGWYNEEKIFMFSTEVIKYIYGVAMERKTGVYLKTDSTKEMKYGTRIEPLIVKKVNEILKEKGLFVELVKFKKFAKFPTAGASSDGVVKEIESGRIVANYEQKACCSWNSHYDRTFELTDEKSTDFWQTQSQMIAWEVDKTYYAVVSPPKDINTYLRAENIDDLYEQWQEETFVNLEIIDKSPIHSNALECRLHIAENTVTRWLKEDTNIKEIFYEEIDSYRLNYVKKAFTPEIKESPLESNEIVLTTEKIKQIDTKFEEVIPAKEQLFQLAEEGQFLKPPVVEYDDLPF